MNQQPICTLREHLELAAVARAGIDVAYRQRTAEVFEDLGLQTGSKPQP